jgi:hypothetical protein
LRRFDAGRKSVIDSTFVDDELVFQFVVIRIRRARRPR